MSHTHRSQYSDDLEIPSRPASSVRFSEEIITFTDDDDDVYSDNYSSQSSVREVSPVYSHDFEKASSSSKYSYVETVNTSIESEIKTCLDDSRIGEESKAASSGLYSTDTFELESDCSRERKYSETFESVSGEGVHADGLNTEKGDEGDESSVWYSEDDTYTSVTKTSGSLTSEWSDSREISASVLDQDNFSYSEDFTPVDSHTKRSRLYSTESEQRTYSYIDTESGSENYPLSSPYDEAARQFFLQQALLKLRSQRYRSAEECQLIQEAVSHRRDGHMVLDKQSEVDALNTFCQKSVQHLKNQQKRKVTHDASSSRPVETLREKLTGISFSDPNTRHGFSDQVINRLKLENTQAKLKKMADMEIHEIDKCPKCSVKAEESAQRDFIKRSLAIASEKLIQDKLAWQQIWCNDQVLLQGEALRDLPSLNEDATIIFDQLMKPLNKHKKNVGNPAETNS